VSKQEVNDSAATIESLRQMMRDFVAERQWQKYHTPRNLAASISIEAAELLEHFQWLTDQEAAEKASKDDKFRHEVGEELADVLMYCMSMANALQIDIAATVSAKMQRNKTKYPPEKFKGHYERPARG
jgi:NTP pyrophosphatase (non-canonical NTP hydrolase)